MATPLLGAIYGSISHYLGTAAGTAFTFAFNGPTDELYLTFVALQSDTADDYDFNVTAVAGGGRTLDVGISEIDGDGRPTGVAAAGGAYESLGIAASGRQTGAFSTPATLVAGTQYAFHIKDGGGAAGTVTISTGFNITAGDANRWGAFVGEVNAGAYGEALQSWPRMGALYSDGRAATAITETSSLATYRDSDNPDERGVKFSVPVSMTINAVIASFGQITTGTSDVKLYDTDGASVLFSASNVLGIAADRNWKIYHLDSDITLTPGGSYRLTVRATNAAFTTIQLIEWVDLAQRKGWLNADADAFEGTTRQNDGVWTDALPEMLIAGVVIKSLNLATAPACSAPSVSYGAWTRTGPNNSPWRLSFLATDGDNPVAAFEVWTGASRSGTQVGSGVASSSSSNSADLAYNAAGLVDGTNALFLSVDDGLGNTGADCPFTLLRDDVDPTASTAVTVGTP